MAHIQTAPPTGASVNVIVGAKTNLELRFGDGEAGAFDGRPVHPLSLRW